MRTCALLNQWQFGSRMGTAKDDHAFSADGVDFN
jgi:hypothetical protein